MLGPTFGGTLQTRFQNLICEDELPPVRIHLETRASQALDTPDAPEVEIAHQHALHIARAFPAAEDGQ
jgi:hypothetical protein